MQKNILAGNGIHAITKALNGYVSSNRFHKLRRTNDIFMDAMRVLSITANYIESKLSNNEIKSMYVCLKYDIDTHKIRAHQKL